MSTVITVLRAIDSVKEKSEVFANFFKVYDKVR